MNSGVYGDVWREVYGGESRMVDSYVFVSLYPYAELDRRGDRLYLDVKLFLRGEQYREVKLSLSGQSSRDVYLVPDSDRDGGGVRTL